MPALPLVMIATALILSACTSRIRDTGTLPGGYESFNAVDTPTVKIRLAAGDAPDPFPAGGNGLAEEAGGQPLLFIVPPPAWKAGEDPWPEEPERLEDLLFTIRERLYRYILREYPHPARVRYAWQASDASLRGYRVLTVESAVTDYKEGNGLLRYLAGWGAGQSRLQLEGRIYEGPPGAQEGLLAEYVVRRGHGGYAQNGLNPAVLRADYTLRYAAEQAIALLTAEFPELIPPAGAAAPESGQ